MKAFTLDDYIQKKIKSPAFKERFDRELLINTIAKMIIHIRHKAKLTQQQLAKKAGTTQAVIARLESGQDERIPSLDLLSRIAGASNFKIKISFIQN
ncbi:MAG: helix-turn-helix domain-containing protein [Gammaproteobacteria bacterium]